MELKEVESLLMEWLGACAYSHYKKEDCLCTKDGRVRIILFTNNNSYHISARPPTTSDLSGYLGCIVNSRRARAGEDWRRGSDLADGPFSHETWIKIISDIVGYELVKIHRPVEELLNRELRKAMFDEPTK